MGKFRGVRPSLAAGRGPLQRPLRRGTPGWDGGGRPGEGARRGRRPGTPSLLPPLCPAPGHAPRSSNAAPAAPGSAGAGGTGRRREAVDGGAGDGRGCGSPAGGQGAQGAGRGEPPGSPGWGRADAGAESKTGGRGARGLRRERPAARLVRTPGAARHPHPAVSSSPETQLPSGGPAAWEGPPAGKACVYAAVAPVTGVARRGRGGGGRAAGSRLRRSAGAGARVVQEHRGDAPRAPP